MPMSSGQTTLVVPKDSSSGFGYSFTSIFIGHTTSVVIKDGFSGVALLFGSLFISMISAQIKFASSKDGSTGFC